MMFTTWVCVECATTFYRPSTNPGTKPSYCGPTCRKRAQKKRDRRALAAVDTVARGYACRHNRTRLDVAQSLNGRRRCIDCGQAVNPTRKEVKT